MSSSWTRILSIPLFFVVASCGSSASKEDASQAYAAASVALSAAASAAASSQGLTAEGKAVTSNVSADGVACSGGGTMDVSGTYETTTGGANFDLSVLFNACSYNGTTMNGTLGYTANVASSAGTYSLDYEMTGSLEYSGNLSLSCDYQLTISVSNGSYAYSGTICGVEVADIGLTQG